MARIRFVSSSVEVAPFRTWNPHRLTCKAKSQKLLISPFQSEISDVPARWDSICKVTYRTVRLSDLRKEHIPDEFLSESNFANNFLYYLYLYWEVDWIETGLLEAESDRFNFIWDICQFMMTLGPCEYFSGKDNQNLINDRVMTTLFFN